jgi:hypothetical protein
MSNYTVEITDEFSRSFRIRISLAFLRDESTIGSWSSLDKGFIKYECGMTVREKSDSGWNASHLVIKSYSNRSGILLYDWDDFFSVNDDGDAHIYQRFVVGIRPGVAKWTLVG